MHKIDSVDNDVVILKFLVFWKERSGYKIETKAAI